VRVDAGVIEGDTVTIFYDPMIAKLIVHADDRALALAQLGSALAATEIVGPRSNIEFLERLVRHPEVVEGRIDTSYLDRHLDEVLPAPAAPSTRQLALAATAALLDDEAGSRARAASSADPHSPWARADAWRLGHPGKRLELFASRAGRHEVAAHGSDGHYVLDIDGARIVVRGARQDGETLSAEFDDGAARIVARVDAGAVLLHDGRARLRLERQRAYAREAAVGGGADKVPAPMPGRIVALRVAAGSAVEHGAELLIMEAMKMEITLRAPRAGVVAAVAAAVGDFVEADAVLIRFEAV
jgi:3-methylcrotonyl-CoA carboxylase alpha subunit